MTRGFPSLNIYLSLGTDFYFSNLIFIKHKSRHSSDILVIPVIHCCYRPWRNKWESYLALCRHLVVSWTPSASWDQFLTGRWYPWVCCSVSLTPQPLWGFKISLIFYWWLNEASVWPGTFLSLSIHCMSSRCLAVLTVSLHFFHLASVPCDSFSLAVRSYLSPFISPHPVLPAS